MTLYSQWLMGSVAPLETPQAFMHWLVERVGSQAELARRAGVGPDQVSNWVTGVNEPRLGNLLKLLRAAHVQIEGMEMPEEPTLDGLILLLRLFEQRLRRDDAAPPQAARSKAAQRGEEQIPPSS